MAVFQRRFRCRACKETFGHPEMIDINILNGTDVDADCDTVDNDAIINEMAACKDMVAVHACNWRADTGEIFSCGLGDFIGLRNVSE